jgi:hypothetical protein
MQALTTSREERGQAIAQLNGQINQIDDCTYTVKSQSGKGSGYQTASHHGYKLETFLKGSGIKPWWSELSGSD